MKDEYDFSKGERGKFYREDARFYLPIYLDPEVESFVEKIAKKQKKNLSEIVNNILGDTMKDANVMKGAL